MREKGLYQTVECFAKVRYDRGVQLSIYTASLLNGLAMGGISAFLAHKQGRNPLKWFAIGLLFGIVGLFAIFFIPRQKGGPSQEPVASPPLPEIGGPADKFWYYLNSSHEQKGPISHNALTRAFRTKEIGENTYVWNEEMTEWKLLREFVKKRPV